MKKILLIMAMIFTFFSCGSSESSKTESVFYYNATEEGSSLDPSLATDESSLNILYLVQEGLAKVDGKTKEIVPALAKSWEVSEDGLTWTFHLREGLKWSDGSPLNANDFAYSWKRALNPETASQYAYMLYPIKNAEAINSGKLSLDELGVKVVDDLTLEVNLEYPAEYFLSLVSFITYFPMNQAAVEKYGSDYALEADTMVYSGPFVIKEWNHNSSLSLVKNENYIDKDSISLDRIEIKFISDTAASLNAYNNDELSLVTLSSQQYDEYKDSPELREVLQATTWYLQLNTTNKFLSNIKIRKAIGMAIDNENIVKTVLNNVVTAAHSVVPKGVGMKGLNGDFLEEAGTDKALKYNVEEAKKLFAEGLAELGLTSAPKLSIILNDAGNNKRIGEALQEQLRVNLGLDVEIEVMTYKERLQRMQNNSFDLLLAGWGADFLDPINFLELFVTNGGNNHSRFSNKEYDEMIKLSKVSTDKVERFNALKRANDILGEQAPIIPLFQSKRFYLVKPNVENVEFSAFGANEVIRDAKIK